VDGSKEYYWMCRRAVEIQSNWKPEFGDDVWETILHYHYIIHYKDSVNNELSLFTSNDGGIIKLPMGMNFIWLPRQDQLQAMINSKTAIKVSDFFWFVVRVGRIDDRHMEIMEDADMDKINKFSLDQLWLMFVMKEKYNKVWNGKNWERR
jgi:hypothetical protein